MSIASNLSFEDLQLLSNLLQPETGFTLAICDFEGNISVMPSPKRLEQFNTFKIASFLEQILERLANETE